MVASSLLAFVLLSTTVNAASWWGAARREAPQLEERSELGSALLQLLVPEAKSFCSTYLHISPYATTVVSTKTALQSVTTTNTGTITTTSTPDPLISTSVIVPDPISTTTTITHPDSYTTTLIEPTTVTVTSTPIAYAVASETSTTTVTSSDSVITSTPTVTVTQTTTNTISTTTTYKNKRELELERRVPVVTPAALKTWLPSAISKACSGIVTPQTSFSTATTSPTTTFSATASTTTTIVLDSSTTTTFTTTPAITVTETTDKPASTITVTTYIAPQAPASTCSTGPIQCCQTVTSANDPAASLIQGLLGIFIPPNVVVGLTCSPIFVIGIGGSSCSANPVCCENNPFNGVIAIGCVPVTPAGPLTAPATVTATVTTSTITETTSTFTTTTTSVDHELTTMQGTPTTTTTTALATTTTVVKTCSPNMQVGGYKVLGLSQSIPNNVPVYSSAKTSEDCCEACAGTCSFWAFDASVNSGTCYIARFKGLLPFSNTCPKGTFYFSWTKGTKYTAGLGKCGNAL